MAPPAACRVRALAAFRALAADYRVCVAGAPRRAGQTRSVGIGAAWPRDEKPGVAAAATACACRVSINAARRTHKKVAVAAAASAWCALYVRLRCALGAYVVKLLLVCLRARHTLSVAVIQPSGALVDAGDAVRDDPIAAHARGRAQ